MENIPTVCGSRWKYHLSTFLRLLNRFPNKVIVNVLHLNKVIVIIFTFFLTPSLLPCYVVLCMFVWQSKTGCNSRNINMAERGLHIFPAHLAQDPSGQLHMSLVITEKVRWYGSCGKMLCSFPFWSCLNHSYFMFSSGHKLLTSTAKTLRRPRALAHKV